MAFPSKPLTQLLGSNGIPPTSLPSELTNSHRPSARPNLLLQPLNLHPDRQCRPLHPPLQPLAGASPSHYESSRTTQAHATYPDVHRARLRDPRHLRLSRQRDLRLRGRRPLRLPVGRGHRADDPALWREPRTHSAHQHRCLRRK